MATGYHVGGNAGRQTPSHLRKGDHCWFDLAMALECCNWCVELHLRPLLRTSVVTSCRAPCCQRTTLHPFGIGGMRNETMVLVFGHRSGKGPMNGACSVEGFVLTVHLRRCRRDSAPYDSPPRFPRSPRTGSAEEWAPNPFDILSGELARSGEWPMTSSCACSMPMCWASFALLWLRHV